MKKVMSGAKHGLLLVLLLSGTPGLAAEMTGPEETLRALVQANADKDVSTLSRLMAHDADIISYTIGGRKYVGWKELERDLQSEFSDANRLELPIQDLKVWTKGDVAWFVMEIDYTRFVSDAGGQRRTVLPLRESGVLENRDGQWILLSWHESSRTMP